MCQITFLIGVQNYKSDGYMIKSKLKCQFQLYTQFTVDEI